MHMCTYVYIIHMCMWYERQAQVENAFHDTLFNSKDGSFCFPHFWEVELLSEMMVKEALNILSICKFVSSVSLLLFVTLCRWVRPRS